MLSIKPLIAVKIRKDQNINFERSSYFEGIGKVKIAPFFLAFNCPDPKKTMYSLSHYSCSHIPAANLCLYVNLVSGHQQVCLPPLPGHPPHRLGPADNHEIVPKDWIEKGKKSQQNGDQHFLKFCLGLLWTHAPHCHLCQP